MARDLRAQATQARRALATVCERRKVRWSFRVARGDVTAEVLSAALEADLLTLGKVSRPLLRRVRVGSTARAAAEGAPCCVLLLQRETDVRPPVVVTYDGSPAARKALLIAAHLALRNKGHVAVLVIAGDPDAAHRLRAEASSQLRGKGLLIRYHPLGDTSAKALALALRTEKGATLVLVGGILQATESLQDLLNDLDCPVLLVR
jgi:nucleotide-binding universal stress UspA family protein